MYCIYLRKSRLDLEAEAHGEGNTLEKHKTMLLNYAKNNSIPITHIYNEVVSGETISDRPEMQRLLEDIESGKWSGVLVTDIDRLSRGNSIDQGIILQTFKDNGVKIITPIKVYDPNDEFDEEFAEFGLFMSRREYKMITRRIQRGRQQSAKEGKFLGSAPPYGYDKIKLINSKGYTLQPDEEEAPVVKKIFDMYISGKGMSVIAGELDRLGIPPRNREYWSKSTISDILKNPVYTGKIRWSYKDEKKDRKTGKLHKTFRENYIFVDGLHPALIDDETFNQAQEVRKNNTRKTTKSNLKLQNPVSGIIRCKLCGSSMVRLGPNNHTNYSTLKCSNRYCKNVSAPISSVEVLLVQNLKVWLDSVELDMWEEHRQQQNGSINKIGIEKLSKEIENINAQITKTFDLLEQGIYTTEVFTERNTVLNNRRKEAEEKLKILEEENNKKLDIIKMREVIIPRLRHSLETYFEIEEAEIRNNILKSMLNEVFYTKKERNTRGKADKMNFDLELYPKMLSDFQE